jgi:TnpA family transposase
MTDTAGYTDVVFGLFRLLGYQFSPRLADAGGAAGSLLQRQTTGSQLMRALRSHTRHLSTLARAIAQVGRAAKTIHLLDYCNDETLRRRILAQLNRGETRHALAPRGLPRPPRRATPDGGTAERPAVCGILAGTLPNPQNIAF